MTVLLKAEHLTRVLTNEIIPATLVNDVSVNVMSGEFMAITGPSGSGKSSLLYLLGLLDRPTRGSIEVDGHDVSDISDDDLAAFRLENMGFVFQSHFLLPEFSAFENIALPMRRLGKRNAADIKKQTEQILHDLGLEEHGHKLPQQMSGGQRQRVAIGRALANDPRIIFTDEPTGNLDSVSAATVQGMLRDIAHEGNRAVVSVTHDPAFADIADRRIHIVDGKISDIP